VWREIGAFFTALQRRAGVGREGEHA